MGCEAWLAACSPCEFCRHVRTGFASGLHEPRVFVERAPFNHDGGEATLELIVREPMARGDEIRASIGGRFVNVADRAFPAQGEDGNDVLHVRVIPTPETLFYLT